MALFLIAVPTHAQGTTILERMEAFKKAFNAKDAVAVSNFYTEKGALLPPQSKPRIGRKAIAAHFDNAFKSGVSGLNFRILEIDKAGPATTIEIGETQVKFGAQTVHGRYLHIWKKSNDTWLLSRDIFHVIAVTK